ncbi:MAG: hypothetical protein WAM97_14430 [Acidimicrobiales bacterium]
MAGPIRRRNRRPYAHAFVAGLAMALGCALLAQPASALPAYSPKANLTKTAPWQVQPSPNAQVKEGAFTAISCVSTNSCIAVGGVLGAGAVPVALAESWNGESWTLMSVPTPEASVSAALNGVSCVSASMCAAVGYYTTSSGLEDPLAESWDGTEWTLRAVAGTTYGGSLFGVSCATSAGCQAVGINYGDNGQGDTSLAEGWDGTNWTAENVPGEPGATNAALNSISCPASGDCEAVGTYATNSSTNLTLAVIWNATTWELQSPAAPTGLILDTFGSVSCTSASSCVAVGYYISTSIEGRESLAESWNGTSWSIETTPDPANSLQTMADAVSCSSPTACTAVGQNVESGATVPLVLNWNGSEWSIHKATIAQSWQQSSFGGVDCTSASSCIAVGGATKASSPSVPMSEGWNGEDWSIQPVPIEPGTVGAALYGVACPSSTMCLAVGVDASNNPVAEIWNGSEWITQHVPTVNGGGVLKKVSCVSATDCIAVGVYGLKNHQGMIEQWNGKTWEILKTPKGQGELASVSCVSGGCMAVGDAPNSSETPIPLAETWDGTTWTPTIAPSPAGSVQAQFLSVSCTSFKSCVAVGVSYDNNGNPSALAESWNGKTWTIGAPVGPPDGSLGLTGVSCPSATDCVAVGYTINRLDSPSAFAESWNGQVWTAEKLPTPSGGAQVYDVACSSADACVAVGGRGNGTLAEGWNGTVWTVEKTANPPGSSGSGYLDGVTCAPSSCTAVGYYTNTAGNALTLVEADG